MEQILYDLDGLIIGKSPFEGTQLEFTTVSEIGTSESPDRERTFSAMLGLIMDELRMVRLGFRGSDVVTIAWDLDRSVGLSVVRVEGEVGFDSLTWINPMVRHCGLGTIMKAHALGRVVDAGATQLRANGDPSSSAFYRTLGLVPV
ncbi:hypothetical protein [Kribbella sp.]|uniref:hypothetical protein n=1 Tax=Kribbella sp. TaxID=1871183 RepID=UPI002D3F6582|nr:hypothetical protein [Kribbella sp.]HZX01459.1 hypothetical protein [Kribbella sp.]